MPQMLPPLVARLVETHRSCCSGRLSFLNFDLFVENTRKNGY